MSKNVFTELLSLSYPALPFFKLIPEGVNVGTTIFIEGFVPMSATKLAIDFIDGQSNDERTYKRSDIPFGMFILFEDRLFVANTRRDGEWGQSQKDMFTAFRRGDHFVMKIIVDKHCYRVVMNGKCVGYQHRMRSDRAKLLRIEGNVVLKRIEFRHGKHYHNNERNYFDNFEYI